MCTSPVQKLQEKHPKRVLKDKLWSIITKTTVDIYEAEIEDLKKYDQVAYAWVKRTLPPHHWCKAFFPHHVKSDMLVNNLYETFNAKKLDV